MWKICIITSLTVIEHARRKWMKANYACPSEQTTVTGDGPTRLSYMYFDPNRPKVMQVRQWWTFSNDPSSVENLPPQTATKDSLSPFHVFFLRVAPSKFPVVV